jgi:Aldehyde:ferredoxin oxidoreductase
MRTLHVDLTNLKVTEKKVTQEMVDTFVGGRGFGLWYLWNATTPTTKWNDPENEIVISPGPIAGITQYPGTGKSLVVSISPLTDIPIDCNVGGYYGPLLKFCGFDALELQGKADREVIVLVDGPRGVIRIEEAPLEPADSHICSEIFTHMYADLRTSRTSRSSRRGRARTTASSAASTSPGTTRSGRRRASSRPAAAASGRSSATRS